jgi:Fic family protein
MGRIRIPEPFQQLLPQLVQSPALMELMGKYPAIDLQGRYLHWNDFQWRVEKDDDKSMAWAATKFSRMASRKFLPLQSEGSSSLSYCVPDSLFAKLHAIDKMTGGGRAISDGTLVSSQENNRYLIKSLMQEEAITSAQLEGASTTREIAKEMLDKNLAPTNKSEQMVLNNYLLMKKAVEKKDEELSIEFILELHKIATHEAIENNAISGGFRENNNIVVANLYNDSVFHPPDYQTIESRLLSLCDFANDLDGRNKSADFTHPIIKAIILHFMVAYIHPFGDGNGRTARAVFYWSILRSGYWLFEYVSISKLIQEKRGDYDKAFIYTETDEFDLTYFLYNQVATIEKAIHSLHEHIDRKKRDFYEFRDWIENSPVAKKLKREHLEILKDALRTPGKEFTSKQVSIELGVTENTARSYLNKLVDKDLLVASPSKRGKTMLYFAPSNLKTRLKLA